MKFIHTADWHLGKLVQGVYMTEDQRYVLEQLIDAVAAIKPDVVIVAGDLYDRAVPPTEAVELLNEILEKLVMELNTPVLAISGNHDSPDRLDFATRMMEGRGLFLAGRMKPDFRSVVLRDAFGEVHVHLVPYADPAQVRHALQLETLHTHDEAMQAVVERIGEGMNPSVRHIFVGHAFVTPNGEARPNTSDSERVLSVGGAEHVRAELFERFHYTALGHLHQAHSVGRGHIRYAGSPLKYSISEESHEKGFYVVEMDGQGNTEIEKMVLKPRRDMRRVTGTIAEIGRHAPNDDYVFVTLTDENPVLFPMEKVRSIYPNALHVERRIGAASPKDKGNGTEKNRLSVEPVELFSAFYREVQGRELSESKRERFARAYLDVLREEGEAR